MSWIGKNGELARRLLRDSLEFHKEMMFVEGKSPDEVLRDLGHRPYEEIAQMIIIRRSLEATIT